MKFIPYSNGLHRLKTKRKRKPWKVLEVIAFTLIFIIAAGALGQVIITKFVAENKKARDTFVRVNNSQYHFSSRGEGDYTVVFDSALGSGKEEWNNVVKSLSIDFDGKIFTYDRSGYGYNDYEKCSIEEQAKTLRTVLKKSAQSGPYLLVGEEYGGLVLTKFAEMYPDEVEGLILVNPLNTKYFSNEEYIEKYKKQKLRKYIEYRGSYLSLTALLQKMNLTKNPTGIFDGLSDKDLEDFRVNRMGSHYNSAYYNELCNILNLSETEKNNLCKDGILKGKPVYIISNKSEFQKEQEELKKFTDPENQTVIQTSSSKDIIAADKSEIIVNAINEFSKKFAVKNKIKKAQ